MPTRPKGQKRPADVIGNAVRVMRIATGEQADDVIDDGKDPAANALGAKIEKARREHDAGAARRDR
ncbi:RNA-binding protein [Mesorhizobium sp. M0410]|uniref:RNA-binding protein n=1 Tax=Mesorhizobium sp. M0410 TaxID=2956943 RepID=UPI003338B0B2